METLSDWRRRVLDWAFAGIVVLAVFPILFAVQLTTEAGNFATTGLPYLLVYAVAVFTAANRGWPYPLRAMIFLAAIYGAGFISMYDYGHGGGGRMTLLSFVIWASVLFGWKQGLAAMGLSLLTMLFVALGYMSGGIEIKPVGDVQEAATWWATALSFLMFGGSISMSVAFLTHRLQSGVSDLTALNADLERRVEERTAELASANRGLDAFASTAAHDLRAPIRHVQGYLGLLREEAWPGLDQSARGYLDKVDGAATRMDRLIEDLLAFSRVGEASVSKGPCDLARLVEEAREELAHHFDERTVEWSVDPLPEVHADRGLMRQVLYNLLENAGKYTRGRDVAQIRVSCDPDQETDGVVVCVTDNGCGFDMRYAEHVFGAFDRAPSDDKIEGSGIGLSTVKRIVEGHGGRVWCTAGIDEGASFYFALPA